MPRPHSSEEVTYFGQVLESMLTQRGLSQNLLSKRTSPHVTQGMISNYKYGRRKPKRETIRTIAKALVSYSGNDFESHSEYKRLESQLFDIAGFKSEYDKQSEERLFIQIIENAGYDPIDFNDDELDQIRRHLQLIVDSIASQKKKYQE